MSFASFSKDGDVSPLKVVDFQPIIDDIELKPLSAIAGNMTMKARKNPPQMSPNKAKIAKEDAIFYLSRPNNTQTNEDLNNYKKRVKNVSIGLRTANNSNNNNCSAIILVDSALSHQNFSNGHDVE